MSMCRTVSCVVSRGVLVWLVHSLGKTLSLCPASFCTRRLNFPATQGILTSYIALQAPVTNPNPMTKRTLFFFFLVLILGLVVFIVAFSFSFFRIFAWHIHLDYCDIEWFALETNRDHSIIFETASKYCISDSFGDYEGYSIPSKGSLSTVVDAMVISIILIVTLSILKVM